jgi:hypothetical protein
MKMKTIEAVAFNRYLSDQSLPKHKRMNAENYIDWANFGAREAQRWIDFEEEKPELKDKPYQILCKRESGHVESYLIIDNKSLYFLKEFVSWRPIERP